MDNHPESEISEGPARLIQRLADDDFRQALLAYQDRLQVLEHQPEKRQGALQRGAQGWLGHGRTAQEGQAAGAQAARVHAKEFIVATASEQAPELRVGTGRHPCVSFVQLPGIDPHAAEQGLAGCTRGITLQQRFTHQLHGDGVFLRHQQYFALPVLFDRHLRSLPGKNQPWLSVPEPG